MSSKKLNHQINFKCVGILYYFQRVKLQTYKKFNKPIQIYIIILYTSVGIIISTYTYIIFDSSRWQDAWCFINWQRPEHVME